MAAKSPAERILAAVRAIPRGQVVGYGEVAHRAGLPGRARLAARADAGIYRLTFDTGAYNPAGFFPEVAIVFRIDDPQQHHHVPLLLSPFGYSTYRGS